MKILYLAGANSIHSLRWLKFFADRGHEIVWVTLAPPLAEAADLMLRTKFYEIKPSPLTDINGRWANLLLPFAVLKLRGIIRRERPDIMHIHSAGTYGFTGTFTGFHPIMLTPWGSDILLTPRSRKWLVKKMVMNADIFTVDGDNTTKKLIEYGARKENIHFVRFATDVQKFSPATKTSDGEKLKIISLRSLEPVYNIESVLEAAKRLSETYPNKLEFILVGGGTTEKELKAYAERLGLIGTGVVRFTGRVKGDALPDLLRASDIYVSTATSDSGLASSTGEAMATGLPVVVTDAGDNKEWIRDGENGFVIPQRDPEALTQKLAYLIEHREQLHAFGEKNRALIVEKYNYEKEMAKVEELYQKMVRATPNVG